MTKNRNCCSFVKWLSLLLLLMTLSSSFWQDADNSNGRRTRRSAGLLPPMMVVQGFAFGIGKSTTIRPITTTTTATTRLYSTTEENKNKAIVEKDDDDRATHSDTNNKFNVDAMLKEGRKTLEFLGEEAAGEGEKHQHDHHRTHQEKEEERGTNADFSSSSGEEYNNNNNNDSFVMTTGSNSNREHLDRDPIMRQVTSEIRVWKQFRQKEQSISPYLPLDVIIERTWDTVEDVAVHLRRKIDETKDTSSDSSTADDDGRKTVVILGSGWASHALMKVADCHKLRIIVVSPTNHFVFTPMLASASVGTVEYRSMTEAVRAANPMIEDYIEGKAIGVNVANKTVQVQLNPLVGYDENDGNNGSNKNHNLLELQYDHLIVSVGSQVNDMNVPGARKHALRLKTTDDARRLRTAVGECFEYASRPDVSVSTTSGTGRSTHPPEQEQASAAASAEAAEAAAAVAEKEKTRRVTFLIAGGGPTGVELAGELCDLFKDITRKNKGTYPKLVNNTRVILAHGGPDLVPQFEEPLRKEALESLRAKGVEVYLNTRVTEVTDKSATLSIKSMKKTQQTSTTGEQEQPPERDDIEIPIGLSIWCAGTAPAEFCQELLKELPPEAKHPDGRINVDGWMRPPMKDPALVGSLLVLGDAAAQKTDYYWNDHDGSSHNNNNNNNNNLLPSTAQVAGQQGAFLARSLCRNYNLTAPVPHIVAIPPHQQNTTTNVFYDPALTTWLTFRGLENLPPFTFLNLGLLAYLGGGEALSQVQVGDVPVVSKSGSIGFFLWRSVYLVKQVATRNRVLVTFDWIKSAIFGRDITRF